MSGPLRLIGSQPASVPAWFIPTTPADIRAQKAAAREQLDVLLARVRPQLWTILRSDLVANALGFVSARAPWLPLSELNELVLKAAFGERQATWWLQLDRQEKAKSLGFEMDAYQAQRLRVALPSSEWTPTRDDGAAAQTVNAVDGVLCAELVQKVPLGSRWRTKHDGPFEIVGYTQKRIRAKCASADGRAEEHGLECFDAPDARFRRTQSPADRQRAVPIGSLWQPRRGGRTVRILEHVPCDNGSGQVWFRPAKGRGHENFTAFETFVDGYTPLEASAKVTRLRARTESQGADR